MPAQLFVPSFRIDECLAEIRECLEKGWTGIGYKTLMFEAAFKDYAGLPHAHFLNSNTSGLHLAFECLKRRLGWADGDEVITTPLTFVSTNHVILHAGLTPVFADVDDYLCLDPRSVAQRITPRTRAVIFVGMGGNVGQYAAIRSLCSTHGLSLVLDAAHMAGTRVGGRQVGHEADACVFSFQAVKNLPTADSGMVCFANPADDERARKLSWLGISRDTYSRTQDKGTYRWRYTVEDVGFKYNGNSIMAAIGLVQLRYLDEDNARRREIVSWYHANLAGDPRIRMVEMAPDCESSCHLMQVEVADRDEVMVRLNADGIYPGVHYHDNTDYPMYAYAAGTCPRAAWASASVISLPLHLGLSRADVDTVSRCLKAAVR